jgi:hypothetical protein
VGDDEQIVLGSVGPRLTVCLMASLVVATVITGCLEGYAEPPVELCYTDRHAGPRGDLSGVVDVLFVVDNSAGMTEAQVALARQLPRMVEVLVTGDLDPRIDGDRDGATDEHGDDFMPVGDLHVGVVTADMGAGGFPDATCAEPNFGDNGILQTETRSSAPECARPYPTFLEYRARDGESGLPDVATAAGCLVQAGSSGCEWQQPLDALLKAITPSDCDDPECTFAMGSPGNEAPFGRNAGFRRFHGALIVVVLTNEDDCSASDPWSFSDEPIDPESRAARCVRSPEALHPITRYRDALHGSFFYRQPLFLAVIAGVPVDRTGPRVEDLLADPALTPRFDPSMPDRVLPSCTPMRRPPTHRDGCSKQQPPSMRRGPTAWRAPSARRVSSPRSTRSSGASPSLIVGAVSSVQRRGTQPARSRAS